MLGMISKKAFIVSLVYLSSLYRASSTEPYPIDMTASRTYEKYFAKEEYEALEKKLHITKKRIEDLEKDNHILDLTLDSTQTTLANVEENKRTLEEEHEGLKDTCTNLENEKKAVEGEIRNLKEEHERNANELQEKIISLQQASLEKDLLNDKLTKIVHSSDEAKEAAESKTKELESRFKNVQKQLVDEREKFLSERNADKQKYEDRIKVLTDEFEAVKKNLFDQTGKIKELNQEKEAGEIKKKELEEKIQDLAKELAQEKSNLKAAIEAKEDAQNEYRRLRKLYPYYIGEDYRMQEIEQRENAKPCNQQ
jgi:chromosome segregation ATPase